MSVFDFFLLCLQQSIWRQKIDSSNLKELVLEPLYN